MLDDLKTAGDVYFLSEFVDPNGKTPNLILNRTRVRPEQVPFPTPLPLPPCPSRRSRELHIHRLQNDMIKQGETDPFLAAFIKCTNSEQTQSSDADSDRRSAEKSEFLLLHTFQLKMLRLKPRFDFAGNALWQQVKAYFSSRARKERKRKSRRLRVGSIGRESSCDDRSRTSSSSSSSSVYVHLRFN